MCIMYWPEIVNGIINQVSFCSKETFECESLNTLEKDLKN